MRKTLLLSAALFGLAVGAPAFAQNTNGTNGTGMTGPGMNSQMAPPSGAGTTRGIRNGAGMNGGAGMNNGGMNNAGGTGMNNGGMNGGAGMNNGGGMNNAGGAGMNNGGTGNEGAGTNEANEGGTMHHRRHHHRGYSARERHERHETATHHARYRGNEEGREAQNAEGGGYEGGPMAGPPGCNPNAVGRRSCEPFSTRPANIESSDTHSLIAPQLPVPPVGRNAPIGEFLGVAENALRRHSGGEAQEALERAMTRALDRSTPPSMANQPAQSPLIQQIQAALDALGHHDYPRAMQLTDQARQMAMNGR